MTAAPQPIPRFSLAPWSRDLELLRQNDLQGESRFLSFAKDRGLPVHGITSGEPGEFFREGWLRSDGVNAEGDPLFHPFRIHPLRGILGAYRRAMTVSLRSDTANAARLAEELIRGLPTSSKLRDLAGEWNKVADLAILLEPLYWPTVTGQRSLSGFMHQDEYYAELEKYGRSISEHLAGLDAAEWAAVHERLRHEARFVDPNSNLYMLLRVSEWKRRERLKGTVSLGLWLRHMAEVIRLGFEEVHGITWPEEDQDSGLWRTGARTRTYGSERPLSDVTQARPYVALEFGLRTGSIVRWYVEGQTEYHAVHAVLTRPSRLGIELINLKGQIAAEQDNAVLKLQDGLEQDLKFRRFSMISFDTDVAANRKAVQRQVEHDRIVGSIHPSTPDFEFTNFSILELAEIAARLDDASGVSGDAVRDANWSGVQGARAFEANYCSASERAPRSLKGKQWGEALAKYAGDHPLRDDTGVERPFWLAIRHALSGRFANYDLQKERLTFNPLTFERVERPKPESEP